MLAAACACQHYTVTEHEGYDVMTQRRGPALGYSEINIIYADGQAFKDLNIRLALHSFNVYQPYSLADILRMNKFEIDTSVKQRLVL